MQDAVCGAMVVRSAPMPNTTLAQRLVEEDHVAGAVAKPRRSKRHPPVAATVLRGGRDAPVTVGKAVVQFDPEAVKPAEIAKAITDEGYQVLSTR